MISFRTVSGRRVDHEHPRPEDVDIRDIACGLSKICRFHGQLRRFYSVGQHSQFVAAIVPVRLQKPALVHDASEAYLNDLSRNLKHSKYLTGYRLLEERWRDAINVALGSFVPDPEDAKLIKVADDLAAVWERVVLRQDREWGSACDAEIDLCVSEGWVKSDAAALHRLAWNVPPWWVPIDSYQTVERSFLDDWARYSQR